MSAKIVLVIGETIENLNPSLLNVRFHVEHFPELTAQTYLPEPATGAVQRLPQHLTKTVAKVHEMVLEAQRRSSYWLAIVTHCGTAVCHVGEMIADGLLPADAVEIWMYNEPTPRSGVPDRTFKFNSEGVLQNWPFGWFEADSYASALAA